MDPRAREAFGEGQGKRSHVGQDQAGKGPWWPGGENGQCLGQAGRDRGQSWTAAKVLPAKMGAACASVVWPWQERYLNDSWPGVSSSCPDEQWTPGPATTLSWETGSCAEQHAGCPNGEL